MTSSNRHWPSMFKSKPHHHQWQQEINSPLLPSSASHRSPFTGCEVEGMPEPKLRWNPKPEQIRILEAVFNSGMVNPPREEIPRIRAQLQEYGQVSDASVFYWFQNRKSRSKHKLRLLHKNSLPQPQQQPQPQPQPLPSSSSSSSSSSKATKLHKTNDKENTSLPLSGSQMMGMFPSEPAFLFPDSTLGAFEGITASSQLGFLSDYMIEQQKPAHPTVDSCTGYLLSEIINGNASYGTHHQQHLSEKEDEEMMMNMLQQPQPYATTSHQITSYNNNNVMFHVPPTTSTSAVITTSHPLDIVPSTSDQQLQVQAGENIRVFINEMEFEVSQGPFNVRDAFGEEVVLINSAGQPIVTDEYGVALQPLQYGDSYYLI
ncbi:unnamed protein product [Eruca vesicaria subsp. sativa]|uniref:Homeobox domain-containing protein n=1 Tax=Eruca vesicaria subsp. sativa TaxID=29727 RepID=A0ABC8J4K2_ERUVS|nr:unnamed protein product [Eruca vesicaria subsp. sativa]